MSPAIRNNELTRKTTAMHTSARSVFPEDCTIIELASHPPRGIGFREDRIEYFDGSTYRTISLKQSVQLYILLVMRHELGDQADVAESCATSAYLKWLRMIARELP